MRDDMRNSLSFFSALIFFMTIIIPINKAIFSNKSIYVAQTADEQASQKYLFKYNDVKIDAGKINTTSSMDFYGKFIDYERYIQSFNKNTAQVNSDTENPGPKNITPDKSDPKDSAPTDSSPGNSGAANTVSKDGNATRNPVSSGNAVTNTKGNNLMDIVCQGDKKVAYLTFDDGPTPNITPKILNVLDQNNVKATFFVVGYLANENKELVKREYLDGNSIGIHSYTHDYSKVYKDDKSFIGELDQTDAVLKSILGQDFHTDLFRFPGGSFEKSKQPFINDLAQRGYNYIDWNALSGDADGNNVPTDKLFDNIKKTTAGKKHLVILMHDAATKETTAEVLPQVIKYIKDMGYTFETLK